MFEEAPRRRSAALAWVVVVAVLAGLAGWAGLPAPRGRAADAQATATAGPAATASPEATATAGPAATVAPEEAVPANPVAWARYRVQQAGPAPWLFTYRRDADGYWLVREAVGENGPEPLGRDELTAEAFDAQVWAPARLAQRAYAPHDPFPAAPPDWGDLTCWATPDGVETFCAAEPGIIVAIQIRRDRMPNGPRDANSLRTLEDWQPVAE